MTDIIFLVIFMALIAIVYWNLCARFNYNPAIEFAIGVQMSDYKLATLKLLEVAVLNFLIAAGIKYSLLAVLEFLIFVGILIDYLCYRC